MNRSWLRCGLLAVVVAAILVLSEQVDAFAARPHIFNLGHGIQQTTPIAHVEQLIELVKGPR